MSMAITLHILAFAQGPRASLQAGGSGGEAMVSIQAAAATVVELVEAWDRPAVVGPEVQSALASPEAVPTEAPTLPQIELSPALRAQVPVAMMEQGRSQDIAIDTTPPPPPPEPDRAAEIVPDTRPKPRPAQKQPQTGRKTDLASTARQKEVSAGSGGASQAGVGTAKVTTGDPGQTARLQAIWGAKIRARIDRNKRYPRGSNASGDVTIELQVARDGTLVSHRLRQSSGFSELDAAAMNAVARAKRFPKAP